MSNMKLKLSGVLSVAELIGFVIVILVMGALMYVMTDVSTLNASRNGSAALTILMGLMPLLVVVTVIISAVKFHDG